MKYLALGDSYTIGESVDYTQNFPNQFIKLAQSQELFYSSVEIIAKTGWRTDELFQAKEEICCKKYDLITLLIGVNNQYQKKSIGVFEQELNDLIEFSLSKVKNKNLVLFTIPDYSFTPFGQQFPDASKEILKYNHLITSFSLHFGLSVVDICPLTQSTDLRFVAEDNLHPSADMYELWAKKLLEQQLSLNPSKDNS